MNIGQIVLLMVVGGVVLFLALRGNKKIDQDKPEPKPELPPDNPPIVYAAGIIGNTSQHVEYGDPVVLDLRHRIAGCDASGNPTLEYGAYDPEKKLLLYRVYAWGPTADGKATVDYAVFNNYGKRIDIGWLTPGSPETFAVERGNAWSEELEALAQCRVFIGHTDTFPPYAMKSCAPEPKTYQCPSCGSKAVLATQMTPPCQKCGTPMQVFIGTTDNVIGKAYFRYEVSDGKTVVESPVLEFIVHNSCAPKVSTRAKAAKK